jgi:hypothetical protein
MAQLLEDYVSHLNMVLNHGTPSDDKRFSDRHLYFILRYIRAELIKNKANKYNYLNVFNYQTIPCLSLEIVTGLDDCPCLPDGVGCQYLRTASPLPKILANRQGLLIASVRDPVGNKIPGASYETTSYDEYTKIKKTMTRYFIHNGYLYLATNNTDLEKISITAIFSDPVELASIQTCDDGEVGCYNPLTQPFPMDDELTSALFKMAYDEIFGVAMRVPQDNTNDAKSGIPE